ncbi:Zwf Glucose-6-phosphate 1-dehydrogenase [Candidatus Nanopelagicaceae bacterium]
MKADALVLFGATGDLARKKLFPALYDLQDLGELDVQIFGVASSKWSQEDFRDNADKAIRARKPDVDEAVLSKVLGEMQLIVGDYDDEATFVELAEKIKNFKLPVIYLAIAPEYFAVISQALHKVGITKRARVVVEKPFGRDLESAKALDAELKQLLPEEQIYRIDHYLGKEAVEDLLVFRFANTLFEPVWNRNYVESIQITMSESFAIEGRGKFYDGVGATRDVLQNHLLQVLTMLTMEPPIDMGSEAMQNEKIKVLSAIRNINKNDVVRGQFEGYLDEEGVAENSDTETFVAMKLFIDNWRWAGVPIYLRTGKKLPETVLEAIVEFKQPPRALFGKSTSNQVRFRLGKKDGVDISLQAKKPGTKLITETVDLSVEFATEFGDRQGPYERLLRAAMLGDHFRFTRIDAVLHSWAILEDLLKNPNPVISYDSASWGPDAAADLVPGGWAPVGSAAEELKDLHD